MSDARSADQPLRGRRASGAGTRDRILHAARAEFAERGYLAASVRAIARRAGVDPGLARYYFGSKPGLFTAASGIPAQPDVLIDGVLAAPPAERGEALLRVFFAVWETPEGRDRLRMVMASVVAEPTGLTQVREFLIREVWGRVVLAAGGDEPEMRTALVASQMFGLVVARYILAVEPLASATPEEIVRRIGPTIQRYIDGREG